MKNRSIEFIESAGRGVERSDVDCNAILLGAEMSDDIIPADLHGMDVHDALQEVDAVIDEAFMAGENAVRIIHGAGTGKLREAVHKRLAVHDHVEAFRSAPGSRMSGVTHAVISRK